MCKKTGAQADMKIYGIASKVVGSKPDGKSRAGQDELMLQNARTSKERACTLINSLARQPSPKKGAQPQE
jgi:hypothetical protein